MKNSALAVRWASVCFALLTCLFSASLLSGCATPQLDRLQQGERQGLPERAEVPAVPFFAQDDLYNGPAALAMTLVWSGLQVTQEDLVPALYAPGRDSTSQSDLVAGARRYGRLALPVDNLRDMLGEIAAGNPVLVLRNLGFSWLPRWQYAVATGYDLRAQTVTLNSGGAERAVSPLSTFERTWARGDYWALVITPPNRLSANATEMNAIAAAAGLRRTGHIRDALLAYEAIVDRWPDSHLGWLALGNARFALKDYKHAEGAYRRATDIKPQEPEAWNNLALAVAQQGRSQEALTHIKRAILAGGPRAATFRETLAEIQQMNVAASQN